MTVKDLKKMLKDYDNDLIVVVQGNDHSFKRLQKWVCEEPAEETSVGSLYEYHGKEHMNKSRSKVVKVLVLG